MVLIANAINLFGVFGLLVAHYNISSDQLKLGYLVSAISAFFITIGSLLLQSYPIVFLNFIWMIISIFGYMNIDKKFVNRFNINKKKIYGVFCLLLVSALWLLLDNNTVHLAWITSFLYILSYYLLTAKLISKNTYLCVCLIGFVLVMPHLMFKQSYSVMINESINAVISIVFLIKYYFNENKQ